MNYCERFFFAIRTSNTVQAHDLLNENPELTNIRENGSLTALHLAAQLGQIDFASLLLDRGADIEAQSAETGSTPLKYAVFFAQIDMVKLLLKRGAEIDNRGGTSRTPLELAESAVTPMFRDMGTPGTDLDYSRIAAILRSRSLRK